MRVLPFVLLFQSCCDYSESLAFAYEFQDQLVSFCQEASWDSDQNGADFIDQFGCLCVSGEDWHLNSSESVALNAFCLFRSFFISFGAISHFRVPVFRFCER